MKTTSKTSGNQINRSTSTQVSRPVSSQTRTSSSQVNRSTSGQAGVTTNQSNGGSTGSVVVCRKCKSPQIVANKRGYSFANMFKTLGFMTLIPIFILVIMTLDLQYLLWNSSTSNNEGLLAIILIMCWISLILSIPVSILVGFVGRNELVNGCMNCGFKWTPAKKK